MTAVTIVGMAAGGVLILTAAAISWSKKAFSAGSITVCLIAFGLIGMSQWSSIKITAEGIEVLRDELKQTATAAEEVAAQVEQTATAVEATKEQLTALAAHLASQHVLSAAAIQPIRVRLAALPTLDLTKLNAARTTLNRVRRP